MKRYRVAIIGAGIGTQHVIGFNANPDLFDVAVICDRDLARAEGLAKQVAGGAEIHGDYDAALLARTDIDIIDICLPPFLHFDAVRKALQAGKHVICEKPLCGSVAEADELAAIAARSGRVLMPIFQVRFGNGMAKAQHLLVTGALGRVFLATVETHWSRGADYYAIKWRGTRAYELGGAFLGHAIHAHDMLTTLLGPIKSVCGATATRVNPIETEDCGGALLEMHSGAIACLSVTLGSANEFTRTRIMSENVTIESGGPVYMSSKEPWIFLPRAPKDQAWLDDALAGAPSGKEGFTAQLALLHHALETGGAPPVTVADARQSLELVTAIYHSARTGTRVDLPMSETHPAYHGWN
ncbi:MAG: Gfo/Idh/MocA family oxidoreductase [Acetobacteraceae bacterium]|nr:Gfo/Idh/MocA family oxidoreductase [Acetobacteraceae bacterium]